MAQEKYRGRVHCLVLYPDDPSHVEALEKIRSGYDAAWILHDRDYDEHGEKKKSHWHVVLRTANGVWNTALCKELGIGENYCEKSRSFDNSLTYLIHLNDTDKAQYNVDEVQGVLKKRLVEKINAQDKNEGEKVCELIDFIQNYEGFLTVTVFAQYCAYNGYWAEFRRSGSIFINIIKEHNDRITEFGDSE